MLFVHFHRGITHQVLCRSACIYSMFILLSGRMFAFLHLSGRMFPPKSREHVSHQFKPFKPSIPRNYSIQIQTPSLTLLQFLYHSSVSVSHFLLLSLFLSDFFELDNSHVEIKLSYEKSGIWIRTTSIFDRACWAHKSFAGTAFTLITLHHT